MHLDALRERLVAGSHEAADWLLDWYSAVDSTNARLLVEPPASVWQVLGCDWQSAGRGRMGRSWLCAPGDGLMMSLACNLSPGPGCPALLGHWAALALLEALQELLPPDRLRWKWPNDVLAVDHTGNPAKLAGLLVQTQIQGASVRAVIGLGLNLRQREFPTDLRTPATSLLLAGVADPDPLECAARWLLALWHSRGLLDRPESLLQALALRDGCRGQLLELEFGGVRQRAELLGYAPDGGIRLRTAQGETVHHDGELRLLVGRPQDRES